MGITGQSSSRHGRAASFRQATGLGPPIAPNPANTEQVEPPTRETPFHSGSAIARLVKGYLPESWPHNHPRNRQPSLRQPPRSPPYKGVLVRLRPQTSDATVHPLQPPQKHRIESSSANRRRHPQNRE